MRHEFTPRTKGILEKRAGMKCSRPSCEIVTGGPNVDSDSSRNLGVAAHITAASPEGPRYDPALSEDERRSPRNGIWLCQTCAKEVDSDVKEFTVEVLLAWKRTADDKARLECGRKRL